MALVEGCRHSLEIAIPAEEVESETSRVSPTSRSAPSSPASARARLPPRLIRKQFSADIRQQVAGEPDSRKHLQKQIEAENLNVVGRPDITDVHFHDGEPLRFKAEFEVVPEIELGEY